MEDLDELEVYLNTESTAPTGSQITSYTFEVSSFLTKRYKTSQINNKIWTPLVEVRSAESHASHTLTVEQQLSFVLSGL